MTAAEARQAYFAMLCAKLEPEAIEPVLDGQLMGTWSYSVPAGTTKLLINCFGCNLNGARLDQREVRNTWLALSGVTVSAGQSDAYAQILDPSRGDYTNAEDLYYQRQAQLLTMPLFSTGNTAVGAADNQKPFLPAPYGILFANQTFLDYAWAGAMTIGANEINDSDQIRVGQSVDYLPASKVCRVPRVSMLPPVGNGYGWHYHILPDDWSRVPDIFGGNYVFRDDFLGAALDTATTWTRTQSAVGNIEIVPRWAWARIKGSGSWTANGFHTQAGIARGSTMVADVYCPVGVGASNANLVAGWMDGTGISYTKFAHGIHFTSPGSRVLQIWENGVSRGFVGNGWSEGNIYRLRITARASGGATYEIQGGPENPGIGGAMWRTLVPTTSAGTTTPLHPGFVRHSAADYFYVSDVRVY